IYGLRTLEEDKIRRVKSSFNIPYREAILLFVDGTNYFLSSASLGVAFTSEAIYWRNCSLCESQKVTWKEFKEKDYQVQLKEGLVVLKYNCEKRNFIGSKYKDVCTQEIGPNSSGLKHFEIAGIIKDVIPILCP
ncbi:MAG: hypothetical protein AAFU64_14420, partial [Bacteroidota bacterium]